MNKSTGYFYTQEEIREMSDMPILLLQFTLILIFVFAQNLQLA
jgi:hypothetical protein